MNVAAHQEKNEKMGKRKAGEEKRQADFKEAVCYPSAVVQGAARRKNGFCEESARVTGTSGRPTSILIQPKWGCGSHHHVEAVINWCSSILLALHAYTIYTTEFLTSLSKKIGVNKCFGDGKKVCNDN